ncbi:MAG: hypothetical protein RLZZ299_436 [Pseudomonadota bacterium]|jgi:uncharacterized protein (DUF58 family)
MSGAVARWTAAWRARMAEQPRIRFTLAGNVYGAVLLGVLFASVNTGNNLLYVVLGALLAVLLANNLLSEWNLRGVSAVRMLPADLYAALPAHGAWRVENRRRRGTAWLIEVAEVDGSGGEALAVRVPAGGVAEVPGQWRFPRRGHVPLARVRIGSRYPFGLLVRSRDVPLRDDVVVFPTPHRHPLDAAPTRTGDTDPRTAHRGGTGDLSGLRPWRAGDPVRRIHWPSSARAGAPILAERSGGRAGAWMVRVDARAGEEGLSRACGAVLEAALRGDAVGLDAPFAQLPVRPGESWRRRLLTALAGAP